MERRTTVGGVGRFGESAPATTGAFLNGYLDAMLVQIPQSIATTLAGGSTPATWTENFNDLSAILNSGLSTIF